MGVPWNVCIRLGIHAFTLRLDSFSLVIETKLGEYHWLRKPQKSNVKIKRLTSQDCAVHSNFYVILKAVIRFGLESESKKTPG
jgi:hypothetical protein